jgi:hypothetical protein
MFINHRRAQIQTSISVIFLNSSFYHMVILANSQTVESRNNTRVYYVCGVCVRVRVRVRVRERVCVRALILVNRGNRRRGRNQC